MPVPDAMPDEEAAGFPVAYGTSHVALAWLARLAPGETLLVTGAAGGVGLTAVEIGSLLGARVIAVARGAEKLAVARAAGAAHLLDAEADLRAEVNALGGADVVYDTVGGTVFDAALRATRPGRRLLPIGFAGGDVPQIPANVLLVKNLTVIGFTLGPCRRLDAARWSARASRRFFAWYGQGRLQPHVSHVLPLEAANDALDLLRAGGPPARWSCGSPTTRPPGTPPRRRPGAAAPPSAGDRRAGAVVDVHVDAVRRQLRQRAAVADHLGMRRHAARHLHADREVGRDAGLDRLRRDRVRPRAPTGCPPPPAPRSSAA